MEHQKRGLKKEIIISLIVLVIVVAGILIGHAGGFRVNLMFLGLVVWAKCFKLSLDPVRILKVWTGGFAGILITLGFVIAAVKAGTAAGVAVLLILLFIQLVLDLGDYCDWIVNPSTPFFLTLSVLMMRQAGYSPGMLLKEFMGGFIVMGVIPMVIASLIGKKRQKTLK